jgi:hypothetical protein
MPTVQQPVSYANLSAPSFNYIWTLGQSDIEGGIMLLNHVYLTGLDGVYE